MIAPGELIVDLFAGGGGASQGIFQALGRNHPGTDHRCESVWKVEPRAACASRPVGLLWCSPDCRHFSRAAGGRPKWKAVRSLPGVVLTWAARVRPRVILVENVREMLGWGPLLADGTPCPDRIGRSFNQWVGRLRGLGYAVQWRELCAADYGAPTLRTRLFVQARCDGQPIVWPQQTFSRTPSLFGYRLWRTAADCIEWDRPCPSIFTRKRPLKDATLRRIAQGVARYVLGTPHPFLIRRTAPHVSILRGTSVGHPADAPLNALTAQGQHNGLISAVLAGCGGRAAQSPPRPLDGPIGTATTKADQILVAAYLAQHNGGNVGRGAGEPVSTLTTSGAQQAVVAASLSVEDRAGAERVAAFLIHYYSNGKQGQDLREPLGAATTHGRFALVTVAGVPTPIVDIGMRMLAPSELARAQGFPAGYDMTDGGRLTKTSEIRLIGNSVCPPVAEAVVRACFNINQAREAA